MASKPIQILSEAIAGAAGGGAGAAGNGTSGTTYPTFNEIEPITIVEPTSTNGPMIAYGDLGNGMCYLEVKNVVITVTSGEADISLGQWKIDTDLSLPCVIDIGDGAFTAVLTFIDNKIHIRFGATPQSTPTTCSFIVFVPIAFLPAPEAVPTGGK